MPLVPQHFAPTDETRSTADRLLVAELALVALRTVDRHLAQIGEPKRLLFRGTTRRGPDRVCNQFDTRSAFRLTDTPARQAYGQDMHADQREER